MKEQAIDIKPEVLLFLRKSSGMNEEEVAKKLKVPKSTYLKIEEGNEKISQNDLILLADIYKRPLISFYAEGINRVEEMPPDYRLNRDKKLSPEVFLAKRKAMYLAKQLNEITGRKTTLPAIKTNISADELANNVIKILEIDFDFLKELKEEPIINYYKSLIEEKFFVPIIEHPLKTNGVRAFSVYNDVSVIVLNESDLNEVKLFSLLHEFCHLLKRQDGICLIDIEKDKKNKPEEIYCDEFAANVLLPEYRLRNEILNSPVTSLNYVNNISKKFGISKLVTLIRMKELKIINSRQFKSMKTQLDAVKKNGFGKRNWEQTYIKRTSRLVLNHLLNSFKKGDLTYTSLLNITGIKDKYLQKLI